MLQKYYKNFGKNCEYRKRYNVSTVSTFGREIKNNYPNIDMNIVIPHEDYIINFMKLFYKK